MSMCLSNSHDDSMTMCLSNSLRYDGMSMCLKLNHSQSNGLFPNSIRPHTFICKCVVDVRPSVLDGLWLIIISPMGVAKSYTKSEHMLFEKCLADYVRLGRIMVKRRFEILWVRQTHRHAIYHQLVSSIVTSILWVRQTHRNAIIML